METALQKRDRARRVAEASKLRSEKAKGGSRARHSAETTSERHATSQWKSTRERGADEERKISDTALSDHKEAMKM